MIEWAEQAVQQLDYVRDYIAQSNSEDIADSVTAQIAAGVQQLESFPMSGRGAACPAHAS